MAVALSVERSRRSEDLAIHPFFSSNKGKIIVRESYPNQTDNLDRNFREPEVLPSQPTSNLSSIREIGGDVKHTTERVRNPSSSIADSLGPNEHVGLLVRSSGLSPSNVTQQTAFESRGEAPRKRRKISLKARDFPERDGQATQTEGSRTDDRPGSDNEKHSKGEVFVMIPPRKHPDGTYEKSASNEVSKGKVDHQASTTQAKTPPKKMMKLRTDGKLFSPKKTEEKPKKSKRGRKPSMTNADKKFVVLNYGSDEKSRQALGEKFQCILAGTLRIPPVADRDAVLEAPPLNRAPPRTPKKTHPFFLGKKGLSEQVGPQKPNEVIDISESPKKLSRAEPKKTTPRKRLSDRLSAGSTASSAINPPFGSSKIPKFASATQPLWPWEGMTHVRGLADLSVPVVEGKQPYTLHKPRKLKGSEMRLDSGEEVLQPMRDLLNISKPISEVVHNDAAANFRQPLRKVLSRLEIQEISRAQLASSSSPLGLVHGSNDLLGHQRHPTHECTGHLLKSLETSYSAFDRFECENQDWASKYSPKCASHILQPNDLTMILRDWLSGSTIDAVDTGTTMKRDLPKFKTRKKRRKLSGLDDFIVSSGEETDAGDSVYDSETPISPSKTRYRFEKTISKRYHQSGLPRLNAQRLKNTKAVIISGPNGCGKTAAIYAIAKELGYEIFELNAGSRRSGRDLFDKVGDMIQNHLVNHSATVVVDQGTEDETERQEEQQDDSSVKNEIETGRQTTMQSFFNLQPQVKKKKSATQKAKNLEKEQPKSVKRPRSQKQSLILFEEVDVLFEEDKQFWNTVVTLLSTSKRPIIMTCTDESLLPVSELESCSILRFSPPPADLAVDHLLLIAAHEGHILSRQAASQLYTITKSDLRASILQLHFWCQMALKDDKGGLNWMLIQPEADKSSEELPRVMSEGTYVSFLEMLSTNQSSPQDYAKSRDMESLKEAAQEWSYDVEDWTDWVEKSLVEQYTAQDAQHRWRQLEVLDLSSEALSAGDIMPGARLFDQTALDSTYPEMSDKLRFSGYTDGFPILDTYLKNDYRDLSQEITLSLKLCSRNVISALERREITIDRNFLCEKIINRKASLLEHCALVRSTLSNTLDPVLDAFESTTSTIAVDTAPYIRSIASFDLRLEQERLRLSNLLSQGGRASKKQRTTRASRAALEGGSKASTRRERWFSGSLNLPLVLETGGKGWQDLLWEKVDAAKESLRREPDISAESE